MPVKRKMMKGLKKGYGAKKGKQVYYAMEAIRKKKAKRTRAKRKK